jgi:23S rRNA pseudouridine1911/1915/1917 synthase
MATPAGPADEVRVHRITAGDRDAGLRLDQFVARALPALSRNQAARLIRDGHVTAAGRVAKPSLPVTPGSVIAVTLPPPQPAALGPEAIPLDILHDDDAIVVVNKPPGMVVHPAAGHRHGTLVQALLHHVAGLSGIGGTERPGIVHRLDRGTSGLIVVAKTDEAHRSLARQFRDRQVDKVYQAVVWGTPKPGTELRSSIGRDRAHRTRMSSRTDRGRIAVTRIDRVERVGPIALVTVTIATGRTHQIRVQLTEAGWPIVGDTVYSRHEAAGRRTAPWLPALGRPALHAWRLGFRHPTSGAPLAFEAPLPADVARLVEAARVHRAAAGSDRPRSL